MNWKLGQQKSPSLNREKSQKQSLIPFYSRRCDAVSWESHKKKEVGAGKVLQEIVAENSPNLVRDINLQI